MKRICRTAALGALSLCLAAQAANPGPVSLAATRPIAAPQDRAYPGEIQLTVDATDIAHRVLHVHEVVSGLTADSVLLYPKWRPACACRRTGPTPAP